MLTRYIEAAMGRAQFERLGDDATYFGHIPELRGVWGNAPELEECRRELREVLEEWLVLALADRDPLPAFDGIDLSVKSVA